MDFKLPDIGEGVHEGEIVKWLVKVGDTLTEDQPMVEVMTDKATVEIPSPVAGKVAKLHYKEGDIAEVETVIISIEEAGEASKKKEAKTAPKKEEKPTKKKIPPRPTIIVSDTPSEVRRSGPVIAMPATRRLAREMGVHLASVPGSGPDGLIVEADLKRYKQGGEQAGGARFKPMPVPTLGEEERVPLRGVRKLIAQRLQMSKHYAPHFTYVEEVDVTDLVQIRNAQKHEAQKQGVKLTYLAYFIKGIITALQEFPSLNASLDETTQEIVYKKYYNIGVAVATEDGLIVPVVKEADQKTLFEAAAEVVRLADAVRGQKAKPDELKGSSFTITSIGSIGGVFATPIINYPDVAILGINKIVERPVMRQGRIVPRHMLNLSLTLDHRVVDGSIAAEFMNRVVEIFEAPGEIA